MKNKNIWIAVAALGAILTMVAFTGCSGPGLGGRSDSQIATDVQSKILGDAAVQNKQLTINSDKGVVTLSGNVNSDAERVAAASDAAQVSGVKTVINNLQVANAEMQQPQSSQASPSESASAAPPRRASRRVFHPARSAEPAVAQDTVSNNSDLGRTAPNSTSNVASAPVVPPPPVTVTIPEGTPVSITLTDPLDSGTSHQGDTFNASLVAPLVDANDQVAIPANSEVTGTVVSVKSATHFKGSSELTLQLTRVNVGGKSYDISTDQWTKEGSGRGTRTAETIGGGAGLGALIGAIAGGGKGAAIGAGVGAAAGTGVQGVTKGQEVKLPSETRLDFRLASPLVVTPTHTPQRQNINP